MAENNDFSQVQEVLKGHGKEEGSLIPVLQEVQALYGYLPEEALALVGRGLDVPLSRVYGVVTFYAQFYLNPRGRHTVRVCRGTACHVRGGKSVLNTVKDSLGIDDGETTADFNFSLETVACLGTCFLAPVMMVDRSYYGKLVGPKVPAILDQFRDGKGGQGE
ncbi:MAG: NADH-quinone oxidoreductase subunit NuoE [Syntrophorhabdales bacterium]|jgi:NADH:ubiquinone oxidoreductase subunit E